MANTVFNVLDITELKKLLQQASEQAEQLEKTLIQINNVAGNLKA